MARNILRVTQSTPSLPTLKRVAAYARVSSDKETMLHSMSAQISYYSNLIQHTPEWQYIGVYTDEGITGTKTERPGFQQMLDDCRVGNIDMVITKSISRFARNTVTMLETIRELKAIDVDVYFEEQNIHTASGDGELMLTILSSFAQEESRSVSENCKWRIRDDFKQGKVSSITMLGYRRTDNGSLEIEPAEAEIVRLIYSDFLSGMGRQGIANKLNGMNIPTRRGTIWHDESVGYILQNEKYTGDMLLQKTYSENHLTKLKKYNSGQLPMYLVHESHKGIIDRDIFESVQNEIRRRAALFTSKSDGTTFPFAGKIVCGICGKRYRRKKAAGGTKYERHVWICSTFNTRGKKYCASKQIPEDTLLALTAEVIGYEEFNEAVFNRLIDSITISARNTVEYSFRDGRMVTSVWQDHSRRDSWTAEMRRSVGDNNKVRSRVCPV